MKFSVSALIIAATGFTLTSAQLPNVPSCALQCLSQFQSDAGSTGCGAFTQQNYRCFCNHRNSFSGTMSCAKRVCNGDQANQAINAFLGLC